MILSSGELHYLKALYRISRGQPAPPVPISVALRLSKIGFAIQDGYGNMRITPAGQKFARDHGG